MTTFDVLILFNGFFLKTIILFYLEKHSPLLIFHIITREIYEQTKHFKFRMTQGQITLLFLACKI